MKLPRLAVICDLREENWPSMDLAGEMLLNYLQQSYSDSISAASICPAMRRRFTSLPVKLNGIFFNADRLINRFWDYPQWLKKRRREFDLFHVIDHSYGQLINQLPTDRTIVTCHDLDTFRCLLEPTRCRRSIPFKLMTKRTLSGFCNAARVTCVSLATRDELLAHGLIPPERVVVIPNGFHPTCSPEPDPPADAGASRLLGPAMGNDMDLLHVGSTVPRKRIDVLLRVFAALRDEFPRARLIRAGGPFTSDQIRLMRQLKITESVVVLPFIERKILAAMYRRAALVLQTSDYEGFGLPVIEAMACGTPVVASDLPVLREVGGDAAVYCTAADVPAWKESVAGLLCERRGQPDQWSRRRATAIAQAAKFRWAEQTKKMVALYNELLREIQI